MTYHPIAPKPAPLVSAIRDREHDWMALTFHERLDVLAWHREEIPTEALSLGGQAFVRRHYKEQS